MDTFPPESKAARNGSSGPLDGVRVLDLSAYIAGPYACSLLADQGADVIKVEPPDGDNLRQYPSTLPSESRAFLGVNRSKRGIVLDLKQAKDHAVLLKLVRDADVLVHNFRPSVPARLGIDHEQLNLINPRLIYCAITGYGESGPMKDKAGYDQVLQTMTGMCMLQGKRGGAPEIIYGSVVDYYAAALLAAGVSSALYERERSGVGQFVGVSLLRSALTMQSARMIWAEGESLDIGARRLHLHLRQHRAFLEGALRENRAGRTRRGPALRHGAQARAARGGDRAEAARGADCAYRAGMGRAVRRRSALCGRAADRGHVRSSAGAGAGHRRQLRTPGSGALSRRRPIDQFRPHAGTGAVRRAGARATHRQRDRRGRRKSRLGVCGARQVARLMRRRE
jgi:hypothetical protein